MIETTRDARVRDAIRKAHKERSEMFATMVGRIFSIR